MKYKAVIFDLYGTLVDSTDFVSYASALRETSSLLKIRHEDFIKLWEETSEKRVTGGLKTLDENLEYICKELNMPVNSFDIKLAKMVRYDYLTGELTPRLYAIETISELKKEGYKLALISNCSMDIPVLWPQTAFVPFFDVTIFSSKCGLRKPDPQIFRMAAEHLGVKTDECLFVDDNSHNLTAAAGIGMYAVLIDNPDKNEQTHAMDPKGEWNGPKITSLPEILDILEEQNEI